jgi:hypothetical protein
MTCSLLLLFFFPFLNILPPYLAGIPATPKEPKNFLRDEQQESQDSYGNPNQCGVQADQQGFPLIFFPELGLFDSFRFTNFGAEIV